MGRSADLTKDIVYLVIGTHEQVRNWHCRQRNLNKQVVHATCFKDIVGFKVKRHKVVYISFHGKIRTFFSLFEYIINHNFEWLDREDKAYIKQCLEAYRKGIREELWDYDSFISV